ncbi:endoglucanase [Marchantia polymorpha subsp. ruderalis]|uniref:cellulase n=1 Tax=Marchantia polymorpha TaxID=3197 RepID=A0A2R6XJJ8_MARPO|nr:hypothetical protein MARPO_0012s0178 [Marchantia polymorpha]BBN18604.1 hypothetical protein Mp_8g03880 [Marchantia polymorpha subsp. ruderalis]|eukprot:PTQ46251.1 hypothetical protein MARPO_0012s0178 [Marchantia polymorpha]
MARQRSKLRLVFVFLLSLLNTSQIGRIGAIQFDYKDALSKSILFLQAQRSGKLPDDQQVTWRGDSGLQDGNLANVDLTGGYYDAGDNIKFGFPMAFTVTMLSWSAIEYTRQITQAGEMENLQSAIRWGTDYFLKAHTGPTQLYVQVGTPSSDHNCWERPEDMDTPRNLLQVNASSPGSDVAAETAAALAAASIVLRTTDEAYAEQLLSSATQLFQFADTYRGNFTGACPFYCSYSGYHDELLWAAAWLYKATGTTSYLQYVVENKCWVSTVSEFSWENKVAGLDVLMSKLYLSGQSSLKSYKSDADSFICANLPGSPSRKTSTTPGGLLYVRIGSNTQYAINMAFLAGLYTEYLESANINQVMCGTESFTLNDIVSFADSQANYVLGYNPANISLMVGFGSNYPQQAHHRGASITSIHIMPQVVGCSAGFNKWYSRNAPNPNVLTGAIVGGPNTVDHFDDKRSDSSCTEPTTYVNAPFVGMMARMAYSKSVSLTEPVTTD